MTIRRSCRFWNEIGFRIGFSGLEAINYIRHLNAVFLQFSKDTRLNPTHISLYVTLFQLWNHSFFKEEFFINREEVMGLSKIGSKSTYHRCIKELSHWDYLVYLPSHNPFKGSRVRMFDFGTCPEQVMDPSHPESETSGVQALVPILKHNQTGKPLKNNNKPEIFKNLRTNALGPNGKQVRAIPFGDNLKTGSDKNYSDPL